MFPGHKTSDPRSLPKPFFLISGVTGDKLDRVQPVPYLERRLRRRHFLLAAGRQTSLFQTNATFRSIAGTKVSN